ncbi:hypothetical protein NDU88_006101 [Pleurodeles waltl]|uniref:Uncharacterized protein n=1 Tax=Pleurodeles waltl TaxID=8319 RepID=A0AAV7TE48_PLEWA|nr:hypothetical protein NDU88_006101 [Pleurodeles waltl]
MAIVVNVTVMELPGVAYSTLSVMPVDVRVPTAVPAAACTDSGQRMRSVHKHDHDLALAQLQMHHNERIVSTLVVWIVNAERQRKAGIFIPSKALMNGSSR